MIPVVEIVLLAAAVLSPPLTQVGASLCKGECTVNDDVCDFSNTECHCCGRYTIEDDEDGERTFSGEPPHPHAKIE